MDLLQRVTADYGEYPILCEFYNDLPKNPYTADDKNFCFIRAKANASKRRYIQPNHPSIIKWLFIDIDSNLKNIQASYYDETLFYRYHDRNGPIPTLIMRNRKNGHVQYAYRLKDPITLYQNSSLKPIKYLQAIESALVKKFGADQGFSGNLAKNPLSKDWDVFLTGNNEYSLSDLAEYLDLEPKNSTSLQDSANDCGYGRNCSTFDYVRHHAYPIAHKLNTKELTNELMNIATEYNNRFDTPMLYNEVKCIVRSIVKYCTSNAYTTHTTKLQKAFSELQRERVTKRWGNNTVKQQKALQLKSEGVSIRKISKQLNISVSTAQRWLK